MISSVRTSETPKARNKISIGSIVEASLLRTVGPARHGKGQPEGQLESHIGARFGPALAAPSRDIHSARTLARLTA
jgi:hypothetical protein